MKATRWTDDGSHTDLLRALADAAFGARFTNEDWDHTCGGFRVAVFDEGAPLAQAAVVPRRLWVGERAFDTGYVEAVCVAPPCQRTGLGKKVMQEVGRVLRDQFELGFLSTSSPRFYGRLGWERWLGASYVSDGVQVRRTAEEDDGLMALRFGPTARIDLNADVTCEARPGDDW